MPGWSFTAPMISTEEEIIERATLTLEDRNRVRCDLYGDSVAVETTPEAISNGPKLLEEAINTLPEGIKRVYLDAKSRCPNLVEQESPVSAFLKCEQYNEWAAARRLVTYWTLRLKLFGPQRAFQPMTLLNASEKDQSAMRSGCIQILPKDKQGRPVLYLNRVKCCPPAVERATLLRIVFYSIHAMMEEVEASEQGFVLLVNIKNYAIYKHHDRVLERQMCSICRDAMPISIKAMHVLLGYSAQTTFRVVAPTLKHCYGRHIRLRTIFHMGRQNDVLNDLKQYGLDRHHLHAADGGELPPDRHALWLKSRYALEASRALKRKAAAAKDDVVEESMDDGDV